MSYPGFVCAALPRSLLTRVGCTPSAGSGAVTPGGRTFRRSGPLESPMPSVPIDASRHGPCLPAATKRSILRSGWTEGLLAGAVSSLADYPPTPPQMVGSSASDWQRSGRSGTSCPGGATRPGTVPGTQTRTLNTTPTPTYCILITLLFCDKGIIHRVRV